MEHGKKWTWVKYKCRCAECCAANDAYMKAYRERNKAKILVKEKERYQRNKDRIVRRVGAYYQREKDSIRRREANSKARRLMNEQRRKARKLNQFVEDVDPAVLWLRGDACGICGKSIEPPFDYHVDHVMPLSRGGLHSYANCQLAHAKCNERKHDRLPTAEELERAASYGTV